MIATYLSALVGACTMVLCVLYFRCRMEAMTLRGWRLDYIVFNAVLGSLCGWSGVSILILGQRAGFAQWAVLVLGVSHLCISYRPGHAFPPDPKMRTDYAKLDEA